MLFKYIVFFNGYELYVMLKFKTFLSFMLLLLLIIILK
jgi:hypothetical protein